jgi:hypothetical protein
MDIHFDTIVSGETLPTSSRKQLSEEGFAVVPGPVSAERLLEVAFAYDEVMDSGQGPDFRISSTTTRMYDFVNRGPAFDEIYLHLPLLEACRHVIGEPFKLSSLLGRTLRPQSSAQDLHVDLSRDSEDAPMLGFILMIDPFQSDNGATRFVPGSHNWPDIPQDRNCDPSADFPGQALACGPAGSMILFNGAIWHGHTANVTLKNRRSIQGYFVRREANSGMDFRARMLPETLARIGPLAQYLLSVRAETE